MPVNVADLLQPIPGAKPSGTDLRYDPIYDKIKDARFEEDEAPQGDWARERKIADWAAVIKLTTDALTKRTKDVNLAVWLTEALVKREGFGGLRTGLELLNGLIDNFWDTLFPEIEDGDAELRATPLNWLGAKMDIAIKQVPLTRAGFGFFKYNEAQQMGHESDVSSDYAKLQARKAAIENGAVVAEDWDKAFADTPKSLYKAAAADLDAAAELLTSLDERGEKFGDASPSYSKLRQALEEVGHLAKVLLKAKLAVDPDPPEEEAPAAEVALESEAEGVSAGGAAAARAPITAEPSNRADAVERIVSAARWLRKSEPGNPASYLLLRGLRWGEVRVGASSKPNPRLLEAPATVVRTQLRTLLLDGKWSALLEAGEAAMAQPCGRGWIDLQRYVITACSRLGGDYYPVEMALRDALRGYLTDVPEILELTMMDDTPTANNETRAWIAEKIGLSVGTSHAEPNGDEPTPESMEAQELARAGRMQEAIVMLTRQIEQERSVRGKFRRKTQLAAVLVGAGQDAIAMPILRDLVAQIENYKLEEWESGDVVAEPMALLYCCLHKAEIEESTREDLYLRICKLDPVRALNCPQ